jgi:amino acid permease
MFSVLNEIGNNSHFRTTAVVVASIGTAATVYILVAITGYLSYGDKIQGNIVSMYPHAVPSTIGRAAIVVLVMFSYPLQLHPCRASVDAILKWRPRRVVRASNEPSPSRASLMQPGQVKPPPNEKKTEIGDVRFAAISTVIIVLSYIVAMSVSSLEKVLAYVGSTGSTSISFILPGLFYYKISDPNSPLHQRLMKEDDDDYDSDEDTATTSGSMVSLRGRLQGLKKTLLRKLALALVVYGVVVMVVCLTVNTYFNAAGGH